MTSGIASVSQTELAQRRRKLRQQRRTRLLQSSWRVVAVAGLAVGSVWVATLPNWVLRRPEQVIIEGNHFIPAHTLHALLPIPYPQSLLRLKPEQIEAELKAKAAIAEVTVNRQLLPPALIVQVRERYPVAIALPVASAAQSLSEPKKPASKTSQAGLLDEHGKWIPLESYIALDRSIKLPSLRIIGNPEHYASSWVGLYRAVRQSPVKISEINWQNPANLILKTELGMVHFGAYGAQFPQQLATLDRIRKLSNRLTANQIAFIDLKNPSAPAVQTRSIKESAN